MGKRRETAEAVSPGLGRLCGCGLELQAEGDLKNAGAVVGVSRRDNCKADLTEILPLLIVLLVVAVIDIFGRQGEVRVVECVERVGAESQVDPLGGDWELFAETQVRVEVPGASEAVAWTNLESDWSFK